MVTNLLQNPGFEAGTSGHRCLVLTPNKPGQHSYETERGEVNNPVGWTSWYVHSENHPPMHDPSNPLGWCEPETRPAPHRNPDRMHTGALGQVMFTFSRIHDGGYYQQVAVTPGTRYRATGWAHAWTGSSDDPRVSCVGSGAFYAPLGTAANDDQRQATFWLGIDPTGGTDPDAESVVWGDGAHVYNVYAQVAVGAVAQSDTITVFTRERFLWPFKHCDGYWDDLALVPAEDEPAPPEPGPVAYAYPVAATGSKLHPHALGEGGTYDVVRTLSAQGYQLPFLKFVASRPKDLPGIRTLKALAPKTRIIARLIENADNTVNLQGPAFDGDPAQYMAEFLPSMREYRDVIEYWELWNEQDPPTIAGHVQMARFAIACMDIAAREGIKLALLSYSTGVPEPEEWQAIWDKTDFFQRAKAGGHILSLHAYSRTADADATRFHLLRPTWLYETLLIPNNCVVPFVHTEYSIDDDIRNWDTAELMAEYVKADELLGGLWYCLGASVFTFGLGWEMYNHNTRWQPFADLVFAARNRQNALPPATSTEPEEPPIEQYDRYVIMADPTIMNAAQLDMAYHRGRAEGRTVTPSWQDAVPYAHDRPAEWRTNTVDGGPLPEAERERYREWVAARDPETVLVFDEVAPPAGGWYPDVVDVRAELARNPASPWYPWRRRTIDAITHVFVHHSAGAASSALETVKAIAAYHTRPTGKNRPGICYTYVIGADGIIWQTSDLEDVVFSQGSESNPGDENRFGVGVCLLGTFTGGREPTCEQIDSLIALISMLEERTNRRLEVWGHKDVATTACPGDHWPWVVGWGRYAHSEPSEAQQPLIGFNDPEGQGAGKWMFANVARGLLMLPVFLGGAARALDYSAYERAGIRVIANLRYSWSTDCGGAGTLPTPGSPDEDAFIDAAISTIRTSAGVWGWEIGNEANNPREWPTGSTLTPDDVARVYAKIWNAVRPSDRLSPGALDPFNAQAGDPRAWLKAIWRSIELAAGAEFVTAHGYTRGPDPTLVGDMTRFGDDPLRWQYRNYPGCVTALLESLPNSYRELPVYVTEYNHLVTDVEPNWGWVRDSRAAEVVAAAHAAARGRFAGIALYRWDGDAWAVRENTAVLNAVKAIAGL